MSRSGKIPIMIPSNIKIIITPRACIIKGPYGILKKSIPKHIILLINSNFLFVTRLTQIKNKTLKKQQGLIRSLLKNMLHGVQVPFKIILQIIGIGYKAMIKTNQLILTLGYSHKTALLIPQNLSVKIIRNVYIIIQGINKNIVSLFGSKIRTFKPPEPYKGTGIKYLHERVNRKVGKSNPL